MDGKLSTTSKMDYKFKREYLTEETYAEIKPLLQKNFEEIGKNKDKISLDENIEIFYNLQLQQKLFCLSCRYKKELVGYIITLIDYHPFYQTHLFAQNYLFFITKEHRKGLLALKFIKEHDNQLKSLNVSSVTFSVKPEKDYSFLLKRNNYFLTETFYRKDLV